MGLSLGPLLILRRVGTVMDQDRVDVSDLAKVVILNSFVLAYKYLALREVSVCQKTRTTLI